MRCIVLYLFLFFLCSSAKAQTDSLIHVLQSLNTEIGDAKLRQAIDQARQSYQANIISDSLSAKLLYVADLLAKSAIEKQRIVSYNRAVSSVLRKLPPVGGHVDYAYSLDYLASSYLSINDQQGALASWLEALSIKGKQLGEDHLSYGASLRNVADLYSSARQYGKALSLYGKELSIKAKKLGEENYDYVNCLISISWMHNYLGHYDTALVLGQKILLTIRRIRNENDAQYANGLMNVARLYHRMGQYDKALSLYEQALAITKQSFGGRHFEYGVSLMDVAYFHHRIMGNYDKALQMYEEARWIMENTIEKKELTNNLSERRQWVYYLTLSHLGTVNYLMHRYDQALSFYQQTEKLFPGHIQCMINLASVFYSMGRQDSSLSLCGRISTMLKDTALSPLEYAIGSNSLGNLYYNMDRYEDALPIFEDCSRIMKESWGTVNLEYVSSLNSLAMVHTALGNDKKAALLFDTASNITLKYLSHNYATLSEQEKIAILKKKSDQFDFLPSLLFNHSTAGLNVARELYDNVLALKGMVLQDQQAVLGSIRRGGDSIVLQLYLRWYKCKAFVGSQHLLPIDSRVPDLDSLENVANELEQELSRHSLVFRNQQRKEVTSTEISRKLLAGQVAIEFIRFQVFNKKWTDSVLYAALLLLPGDSTTRFVPLFEEKELQQILRPYAGSTTAYHYINRLYGSDAGDRASTGSLCDSLYNLVWKPLENYLAHCHTIYYAPAGLLHNVAFNALRYDTGHFLMEKYRLNQVLTTRSVLTPADELQTPLTAAVWGDIDYDQGYLNDKSANATITRGLNNITTTESIFDLYTNDTRGDRSFGWPSLSNTKKEMDSIGKTIGKTVNTFSFVRGRSATEESFKALNGKSPQLLHVATHGFFLSLKGNQLKTSQTSMENSFTVQQNPMFRSGLVLAGGNHAWKGGKIPENSEDGILTAYEIAHLDLSNVELLVLSACETALGETKFANEGVFGLQRAFKLAGVKKMIMSLWQVPDKESAELVTLFYNNWIKGQSIREALHNAQMTMKGKKYPPFFWAAFVVVE